MPHKRDHTRTATLPSNDFEIQVSSEVRACSTKQHPENRPQSGRDDLPADNVSSEDAHGSTDDNDSEDDQGIIESEAVIRRRRQNAEFETL